MTREELEAKVKEMCPEMLTHENFMHAAECAFCKNIPNDNRKTMSDDELESYHKLSEKLNTATVAQVIEHLKKNFKLDDKLCYMDCIEGVKNDCTYVTKDQLGHSFFYYVKDLKRRNIERCHSTKEQEDNMFPYVDDNDIIMA